MKIHHVFGHQDRSKDKYLTLQAKLNIRADKFITVNTRNPLQININNTSVAFYLKKNTSLITTTSKSDPAREKGRQKTS